MEKVNSVGKKFSRLFFSLQKKVLDMSKRHIQQALEKSKSNFYRKFGYVPSDRELKEMEKEIVMKQGLLLFFLIAIIVFIII